MVASTSSNWLAAFLIFVLCALGGCEPFDRLPPGTDVSTPKPAALAYLRAIRAGNSSGARALSSGDADQKHWVDALASLVGSMREFDNALYARFGRMEFQIHTDLHESISALADEPLALITSGDLTENGEVARIDPSKGKSFTAKSQPSIYLLHTKEGWRVDVLQTYAPGVSQAEIASISASFAQYRQFANAINSTAQDISWGRFKTIDDAARGLAERIQALRKDDKERSG